ncbi:uncharacterized protein LDX57_006945 [Aspergillus melleus]|uniref:uncharacterized protein n=1 Tax=Aspergillus melleus TaxID=138277 RepID=UPI001E8DFEF1|nr:uncharacterized protein LDX57_006945 [Aspergillus melleus]KAH8429278.1 hypothetical protein LDX57_006945 [Aspergillus melleus]
MTHVHDRTFMPDVIIIGAGFAGVSTFYHLRKLGLVCQIVEKEDGIGNVGT